MSLQHVVSPWPRGSLSIPLWLEKWTTQDLLHARTSRFPEPQSLGVGLGRLLSESVCVCVCLMLSGRKTDLCDTVCMLSESVNHSVLSSSLQCHGL